MRLTQKFQRWLHRDQPAREPTTLVPSAKDDDPTGLDPGIPSTGQEMRKLPADDPRADIEPAPAGGPVEGTVREIPQARSRADSLSSPGLEDEAAAGPSVDVPALEPKHPTSAGRPPTGPVELVPARTGPTGPASDAEAVLPGEVEGKPRPRSKRKRHGRKR